MTDPLKVGPDRQRVLFEKFVELARDHSLHEVVGSAVNLLINAIRQGAVTKQTAEKEFDELMGKTKQLLMNHYDSVTGKRRNVFPFTQVIEMPQLDLKG